MLDLTTERIIVTGGAGFLGRFVRERLLARGVPEASIFVPRRNDYDLTQLPAVERMYDDADATVVIHLAGRGGRHRRQPRPTPAASSTPTPRWGCTSSTRPASGG